MATQSIIQRAFVGGELSPALGARADQAKYTAGAKEIRNLIVMRHGGVTRRCGTYYVAEVKDSAVKPALHRFVFSSGDQTYLLEFGHLYVRFYWHQGQVAGPYEVATPYTSSELAALKVSQSTDTIAIFHPSHPPYELKRAGHTSWSIAAATFAPTVDPPTGLAVTPGTAGAISVSYVVVSAKVDSYEQSVASSVVTVSCAEPTAELPNVLTWTPPASGNVAEYLVFCDPFGNGLFGYIGTAASTTFRDPGFVPDQTITPIVPKDVFNGSGKYPSVGAYYQQRLMLANTTNQRETVWGSRVGAYHNFGISTPLQDDDAVEFIIAGEHLAPVQWLVAAKRLLVFNDEAVYAIMGDSEGALRPVAISPDQQAFAGAADTVEPVRVANSVLYLDSSRSTLRDLTFDQQQGAFAGIDLTIFASHLFDGYAIVDIAYARTPHSIIWAVRSDGVLLGLTYVREQEVWAWHRHDTDGVVEAVEVVPNPSAPGDDTVYLLVRRNIDGVDKRYIETFGPRHVEGVTPMTDAFFVDCGLTYSGAPARTFSGLGHLEGKRVAILGDGEVVSNGVEGVSYVVTGGAVTIPVAKSKVHIGLPIPPSDLITLDLDVNGSSLRDKRKRVQCVTILTTASQHGWRVGLDENNLRTDKPSPGESAATRLNGISETSITTTWNDSGSIMMRQIDPVPFTVLGIIPVMEQGGA